MTFTVYERQDRQDVHRDRLEEFTYHSSQVKTEFVDPDREPGRANEAKIEALPTILIQHKGRTERVTSSNEQDLTNALIKAVTGQARKVYFTQGHGEKDIASSERTGYSTIAEAMKRDNYTFESLVLITQKAVPDDATILVIAGPTTDFFPPEIEALNAYVAKGGKVMVLLDPPAKAGATQPLLTQFLTDWGINAGNDVVLDASGMGRLLGTDASVPVVAQYPNHPITESLTGAMSAYPMARSMAPIEGGSNSHIAQPRADHDAAELGRKRHFVAVVEGRAGRIQCRQGRQAGADHAGRRGVGARHRDAAEARQCQPRCTGCAEHAAKRAWWRLAIPTSRRTTRLVCRAIRDFFMNSLNWLAQQENLIAVRPRQPQDHRLTLTADQQNRIMILSLFIIPGLVFATGVYTWWRRR